MIDAQYVKDASAFAPAFMMILVSYLNKEANNTNSTISSVQSNRSIILSNKSVLRSSVRDRQLTSLLPINKEISMNYTQVYYSTTKVPQR